MSKTDWQKRCEEARRMLAIETNRVDALDKDLAVAQGKLRERDAIIVAGRAENKRLTDLLIEATLKLKTVADREAAWLRAGEADLRIGVIGGAGPMARDEEPK